MSGGVDKSGLDKLIADKCKKKSQSFSLHYTEGKNDEALIKKAIEHNSATTVVACGGDGTINMVAGVLLNTSINLGIMPLGSANGLASEFNIPEDLESSLEVSLSGKAKPIDVIQVNDEISLHLSDVGFNAQMIQEFEQDEMRGKLGYAKAFFKSMMNRESKHYAIIIDDKTIEVEAEMLVFANASSYGTGAIINPESKIDDGLFEIVVFKPLPLKDLPSLTFESFLGNIKESPFVEIYQVKKAEIKCNTPQLLQVDGELINEVEKVKLSIISDAIRLIAPLIT